MPHDSGCATPPPRDNDDSDDDATDDKAAVRHVDACAPVVRDAVVCAASTPTSNNNDNDGGGVARSDDDVLRALLDLRGGVVARAADLMQQHADALTAALRDVWRDDDDDNDDAGATPRRVVVPREAAEALCAHLSAHAGDAAAQQQQQHRQQENGGDDAMARLVAALAPACLQVLALPCDDDGDDDARATATTTTTTTHASREQARRLLLAAFDADFASVTAAVAAALSPALLRRLLRRAARAVCVGECVVALLGSALPATTLARPSTHTPATSPRLFAAAWCDAQLPRLLVACARDAVDDARGGACFGLLRELLLRGGSCGAGPVVDELLAPDVVDGLVDIALVSCERALDMRSGGVAAPPLCHAAVDVLTHMVRLTRRALLPPPSLLYDDDDDDALPPPLATSVSAPLCMLLPRLPRFAALLRDDGPRCRCCGDGDGNGGAVAALASRVRRAARAAVCGLLVELALLRRRDVDAALCACDAVALLLRHCRAHPHSDRPARLLRALVDELAARQAATATAGARRREVVDDALLAHVLRDTTAAAKGGDDETPPLPLLVTALVDFAVGDDDDDDLLRRPQQQTPLSAFSVDAVDALLSQSRDDDDDDCGGWPLTTALRRALRRRDGGGAAGATVAARVRAMRDGVVGGGRYSARGSAGAPAVTHRRVVDLAGGRCTRGGGGSTSAIDQLPESNDADDGERDDKENAPAARVCGSSVEAAEALARRLADEAAAARQHGSPQLRAYPAFKSLRLSFGGAADGDAASAAA